MVRKLELAPTGDGCICCLPVGAGSTCDSTRYAKARIPYRKLELAPTGMGVFIVLL